ncbi:MAG: cytochrome P450 [Myxococcota bacterium]
MVQRHGKSFAFSGAMATSDPEVVKTLLTHRPHTHLRSRWYQLVRTVFPGLRGLLFVDDADWRPHAVAMMPGFKRSHVDGFSTFVHGLTTDALARWSGRPPADLADELRHVGRALFIKAACGLGPEDREGRALGEALADWLDESEAPNTRLDQVGMGLREVLRFFINRRHTSRAAKVVRRRIARLVQAQGWRRPVDDDVPDPSWVAGLARAGSEDRAIADELMHLYWAFDALAFSFTACVLELSRHPDLASRVAEELQEWGSASGRSVPSRPDFPQIPLTQAFILEVLRCHPATWTVARRLGEPMVVAGRTWPKGSEALILMSALQRNPEVFDRPHEFDPDRWLRDPDLSRSFAFVPFLRGPRKCVGRHLAETALTAFVAAVAAEFAVQVRPDHGRMTEFAVSRFADPLALTVSRRSPATAA